MLSLPFAVTGISAAISVICAFFWAESDKEMAQFFKRITLISAGIFLIGLFYSFLLWPSRAEVLDPNAQPGIPLLGVLIGAIMVYEGNRRRLSGAKRDKITDTPFLLSAGGLALFVLGIVIALLEVIP